MCFMLYPFQVNDVQFEFKLTYSSMYQLEDQAGQIKDSLHCILIGTVGK